MVATKPVRTTYPDRASWLAARRQGIGSSDVAALVGLSPWQSAFGLWAEKSGLTEPDAEATEAQAWGLRLEPVIAAQYAEETGRTLVDHGPYTILQHPEYPWLLASLDREIAPTTDGPLRVGPGTLECKTASAWKAGEWADEPPLLYQIQHEHQLLVTGYAWGSLAVLIGGQKFYWQDRARHADTQDLLLNVAGEFWQRVQKGEPPPPDGSAATKAILASLYPRETSGQTVVLPPEAVEWDAQRLEGVALIERGEALKNEAENLFRASIGEAETGLFPDGKAWFTFKQQTRKEHVVAASTFRRLFRHTLKSGQRRQIA
jgi:putative phage-type endonuclease